MEFRNRLSQGERAEAAGHARLRPPHSRRGRRVSASKLAEDGAGRSTALDAEIDRLERILAAAAGDGNERERISGRLRSLLAKLAEDRRAGRERPSPVEIIESASADRAAWS